MGFRTLRERWHDAPELAPPVPAEEQARGLAEALATDFDRFLDEPGARAFLAAESERRLAALIRWTTTARRSWTP